MSARQRWNGHQRRIGVTGGIASGKSSIGKYLQKQGLPVLDADIYAHEALAPGCKVTELVLQRYGSRVEDLKTRELKPHPNLRQIDRRALGQIVFNNSVERLWLEQLIHPIVRERLLKEIELHSRSSALVLMIPLLFEAGLEVLCSEVWVVHCSSQQQQDRLMARNGFTAFEAKRRIEAQWPLEQKRKLADQVIDNNGAINGWESQVLMAL